MISNLDNSMTSNANPNSMDSTEPVPVDPAKLQQLASAEQTATELQNTTESKNENMTGITHLKWMVIPQFCIAFLALLTLVTLIAIDVFDKKMYITPAGFQLVSFIAPCVGIAVWCTPSNSFKWKILLHSHFFISFAGGILSFALLFFLFTTETPIIVLVPMVLSAIMNIAVSMTFLCFYGKLTGPTEGTPVDTSCNCNQTDVWTTFIIGGRSNVAKPAPKLPKRIFKLCGPKGVPQDDKIKIIV